MSSQAKDLWTPFYNAWEFEMSVRGSLAGTWSKLKSYCLRLALVLQLLRWACGEAKENEIDDVSMTGAVTLTHYFASHAERVSAAMRRHAWDSGKQLEVENLLLETLLTLVPSASDQWTGTATDLLQAVTERVNEDVRHDPHWPRTSDALGRRLRTKAGSWKKKIVVEFWKEKVKKRTRMITLRRASDVS